MDRKLLEEISRVMTTSKKELFEAYKHINNLVHGDNKREIEHRINHIYESMSRLQVYVESKQ